MDDHSGPRRWSRRLLRQRHRGPGRSTTADGRAAPPVSSGFPGGVRHDGAVSAEQPTVVTQVRDAPLSVDEALAAVSHPRAGAVALFVGTVREHDEGREGVSVLEYSAHPDAVTHLRRIALSVASAEQVHGVYAVHRTGALQVGDLAVVCAVSAEHRAEAFVGGRRLIEELKAEVPIWKRQEWNDGDHSWVGL